MAPAIVNMTTEPTAQKNHATETTTAWTATTPMTITTIANIPA